MSSATYTRFELVRTFRNRRFMIFSVVFPVIMFLLIASPQRHTRIDGIRALPYLMVGMMSYGAMAAVISSGARIAAERQVGWHRQLRITPLSIRTYFAAKVLSGYVMAVVTVVVLSIAGTALGVRISAPHWLVLVGLVLVGLIPFAVLGILLGHLLKVDSMGPAIGGATALFGVLGGSFGSIASGGLLLTLVKGLPSYWLVQAGPAAIGGRGWPTEAWVVLAVWTAVLLRITRIVYQRDTNRV